MSLLWGAAMKRIGLGLLIAFAVLGAVHFYSLEGLQGWIFARMYGDDTVYSNGFSDAAFRKITRGMAETDVRSSLPTPLGEVWLYEDGHVPPASVSFTREHVDHVDAGEHPMLRGIRVGATKQEVVGQVGLPIEKTFVYSRSRNDRSYHVRVIDFKNGKVNERISEFYVD